jgi:type 2 lantibiotic biosynthesis protein LanM
MNIQEIIAKSKSIQERVKCDSFCGKESLSDASLAMSYLTSWCGVIAKGDWSVFENRLAWDNMSIEKVKTVLGITSQLSTHDLPDWALFFMEVMDVLENQNYKSKSSKECVENAGDTHPFHQVLSLFVDQARKRLVAKSYSNNILANNVLESLASVLMKDLSTIASKSLFLEFAIYRAKHYSTLDLAILEASKEKSTVVYDDFIQSLLQGQLIEFFSEYAVLARTLSVTCLLWVEASTEFIQRLSSDLPDFAGKFFNHQHLGTVCGLDCALSDYHNGRRSVYIVKFTSGDKIVYKPKDMSIDSKYSDLICWLNVYGIPIDLKAAKVWPRDGYGWMEFIPSLPCDDKESVQRFYRRAGTLLCLIYLLDGVDCIYENLIANGEYPILIDLETLMHNNFKLEREYAESFKVREIDIVWWDSVFRVGMLPKWQMDSKRRHAFDIGGLRDAGRIKLPHVELTWKDVNTDSMKSLEQNVEIDIFASIPSVQGQYMKVADYTSEVADGFRRMYLFCASMRHLLIDSQSPIQDMAPCKIRYIFRNTKFYSSILQRLTDPQSLRDGISKSILIDIVTRIALRSGQKDIFWPLIPHEIDALQRLDIPFFTMRADDTRLHISEVAEIAHFCKSTSIDNINKRIYNLSESDLNRQVQLIEGSLILSQLSGNTKIPPLQQQLVLSHEESACSEPDFCLEATRIADIIKEQAYWMQNGSINWLAPQIQAATYIYQPMRLDFFGGISGLIFFLAALEASTSDQRFNGLINGAIQSVMESVMDLSYETSAQDGYVFDGLAGLTSLIYAFSHISIFTKRPEVIGIADKVASLISDKHLEQLVQADVIYGAAGTILSLLSLYSVTGDKIVLAKAKRYGERICDLKSSSHDTNHIKQRKLAFSVSGFSHGIAGIAYALIRLHQVCGDDKYLDMAFELMDNEMRMFNHSHGNWPDLRSQQIRESSPNFMTSWCNGSPGIVLARLAIYKSVGAGSLGENIILHALNTISKCGIEGSDNLCCGNFGRIEVLKLASESLRREDYHEQAIRHAARVVLRSQARGSYQLFSSFYEQKIFYPSFFQGVAGIGYQLLRLANFELPAVLLLSPPRS